jgi:hypothetical protein
MHSMGATSASQRVTKLEAAQRQLGTATELYFLGLDEIAIHTLVAASYNIIRDLSKHRGLPEMAVKDYLLTTISASQRKQVSEWLNSFENFFKHADRDPGAEIELSPVITEAMLIDAWAQYERLGGTLPEVGKVFKLWSGNIKDSAPPLVEQVASALKKLGRKEFYRVASELMSPATHS